MATTRLLDKCKSNYEHKVWVLFRMVDHALGMVETGSFFFTPCYDVTTRKKKLPPKKSAAVVKYVLVSLPSLSTAAFCRRCDGL